MLGASIAAAVMACPRKVRVRVKVRQVCHNDDLPTEGGGKERVGASVEGAAAQSSGLASLCGWLHIQVGSQAGMHNGTLR